jgi:hypothetical protein
VTNRELTPGEKVKAGAAFADVYDWAGSAWRSLRADVPPATRANVLASVDELIAHLEEVRALLSGTELPSVNGDASRTGGT